MLCAHVPSLSGHQGMRGVVCQVAFWSKRTALNKGGVPAALNQVECTAMEVVSDSVM